MFRALKSLIAGLIAGLGLGILFSPKKGSDVRDGIKKDGVDSLKDTLVEMGKDISATCKGACEDVANSKEYKKATTRVKKEYKNRVPAKTRKLIAKDLKKAKTVGKKAVSKVKKEIKKRK